MLPATKEDQYISEKYCSSQGAENPDIYRKTYAPANKIPKKKKSILKGIIGLIKPNSLEERLGEIANKYDLKNIHEWRSIDKKAYNQIMMCRRCRKDRKLKKYYYDLYRNMVKPFWDLQDGFGGIDEQEEEDVFENIKKNYFSQNSHSE